MSRATRMLAAAGLAAGSLTAFAAASPPATALIPSPWCSARPAPCIESATHDGSPVTSSDPTFSFSLDEFDPGHYVRWNLLQSGDDELGPAAAGTWSVVMDVGTEVPRVVYGTGRNGEVVRIPDGDGSYHVTTTAEPTLVVEGCDSSSWPWTCPSTATAQATRLSAEILDWSSWEDPVQRAAFYGVDFWTNVSTTSFPPLSDIDRLARLIWDADRPVQIVFAGKAHPADRPGQAVIQEIFQRSRSPQLRGRVFILEDYDMRVGRFLVQGVDAWLNNPRRPLEASGTSGMKAAQNGVPSISVLDGWWDEGFTGDNGWAIGGRDTNPDDAAQDWADAQALYGLLEGDLIPRYYERDEAGIPLRWVEVMRRSMSTSLWRFSTTRMLHEYTEQLYLPAAGGSPASAPPEPVTVEPG